MPGREAGATADGLYPDSVTTDHAAARYRRRRRWPMLVVIVLLLAGAGVIWFQALKPQPTVTGGCNKPGAAPTSESRTSRSTAQSTTFGGAPFSTGKTSSSAASTPSTATSTSLGVLTDKNTLANVRPGDPGRIPVKVFNASAQRGMAKTLSDEMRQVGFESIVEVTNDPLYPASDLRCVGEIRYGQAGVGSARAALIMMPCAQLVVDSRIDESVDIAVGNSYVFADTADPVKAQLKSIKDALIPPAVIDDRTAAPRSVLPIPPLPTASCPS